MEIEFRTGQVWQFEPVGEGDSRPGSDGAPVVPENSIALDGAVQGPRIDSERRRFSFDHHANCERLCTTATCRQVFDALLLGLDPSDCVVLVNDVDGDTVLAVWLLQHHTRWRCSADRRRVLPLVETIGSIDAHGPAYPVSDRTVADHFYGRIMQPAHGASSRPRGNESDDSDADGTGLKILRACLERLEEWWRSGLTPSTEPGEFDLYPEVEDHGGWVWADSGEFVAGARVAGARWLYDQGYDRLVMCMHLSEGRHRYTLAKRSDLVDEFPIRALCDALNREESAARGHDLAERERWGGASTIAGSPRDGGSVLSPAQVIRVVERVIANARKRRHRAN